MSPSSRRCVANLTPKAQNMKANIKEPWKTQATLKPQSFTANTRVKRWGKESFS